MKKPLEYVEEIDGVQRLTIHTVVYADDFPGITPETVISDKKLLKRIRTLAIKRTKQKRYHNPLYNLFI